MVEIIEYDVQSIQIVSVNNVVRFKNKEDALGFFDTIASTAAKYEDEYIDFLIAYGCTTDDGNKEYVIFAEDGRVFIYGE